MWVARRLSVMLENPINKAPIATTAISTDNESNGRNTRTAPSAAHAAPSTEVNHHGNRLNADNIDTASNQRWTGWEIPENDVSITPTRSISSLVALHAAKLTIARNGLVAQRVDRGTGSRLRRSVWVAAALRRPRRVSPGTLAVVIGRLSVTPKWGWGPTRFPCFVGITNQEVCGRRQR